jgi:hypothetical protein
MRSAAFPLLTVAFAFVGCSLADAKPTLCQLAANRSAYAGQTVTVEGLLLVGFHGSALEDPSCHTGVPIAWFESDGLTDLNTAAARARREPLKIKVRVTGKMQQAPPHDLVNEPYWELRVRAARVITSERSKPH